MKSYCENCGGEFDPPEKNAMRRTCTRSCAVALSWKNPQAAAQRRKSISVAHNTPDASARIAAHNRRRWSKASERKKLSERNRQMWANPNTRDMLSEAIKTAQRKPENRAHSSQVKRFQWANDKQYRARTLAGMQKRITPEFRALFSKLLSARWRDPVMRAKYIAGNKRHQSTPEAKARHSRIAKEKWADAAFRARVTESLQRWRETPEAIEKMRERQTALWANPEWAAKTSRKIAQALARKKGATGQPSDLVSIVARAIPLAIPPEIRADICQELLLSVLEGELSLADLKKGVAAAVTKYNRMFPGKFGPISIDAPIPGTEGFTIADTLSNDTPHF